LVKSFHPIDEIAARISRADGAGVRLTHAASACAAGDEARGIALPVDPAAAVALALAAPLEFPPLSAGVVPGDRVAIAVDNAVPCVAAVVRGAVEALRSAGVEPRDISIIATEAKTVELCREELSAFEHGPQFVVHDPADEKNLCLIGVTKRGQPLFVNRTIFEADIVLPIGCARVNGQGVYNSLYPRFSNAETVEKSRTPAERDAVARRNGKRSEADEAGWMIGALMTVEVVPGSGETVAHVLAGEPQAVARRSEELCRRRWLLHSPRRVSLLIATVTGGAQSQTWANIGRALAAAEHVLEEGGAVAICSNLEEQPGHSLGRLIRIPDIDVAARKISHDRDADSWPAWHLARALQRGPVYFLSQLSAETVEDLGLAPVESVDDLVRLAGRHESFAVVDDSQHAVVIVNGEDDAR